MITTIDQATELLKSYIPKPGLMHHNYKLERMQHLMDMLDNPQNSYPVIHIAGTSGKTSTSYFIRALLQAAGQKTGLTVSPHIQSITERIQIDGQPISDEKFVMYLNQLLAKLEDRDIEPTYFELLMALAYLVFREEGVNYAVIETGLGGLLDATNVVTRPDKVCVITDIGLDHTDVLGHTVQEIALQKAGIIQPGNVLILQHQDAEIEHIIEQEAQKRGAATIQIVPEAGDTAQLPLFQRRNWAAAETAYTHVAVRDSLVPFNELATQDAMQQQPPGRMEQFMVQGKTIILDGAHNPQKLHALVASLQEKDRTSLGVLVSFVDSKKDLLSDSLHELLPVTNELVVTDFSVLRDVGKTASLTDTITATARELNFPAVVQINNPREALQYLLQSSNSTILVTGSLYLIAQLRQDLR